jgi:hypothetical protein
LAACHPLDDLQITVHTAAWKAFDSFVKSVPKDELEPLVVPLRRTIKSTGAPGRTVPLVSSFIYTSTPWMKSVLKFNVMSVTRSFVRVVEFS